MLDYKKDPTRPGGGVFVAAAGKKGEFHDVPAGTIISGSSEDGGGEGSAASDSEGGGSVPGGPRAPRQLRARTFLCPPRTIMTVPRIICYTLRRVRTHVAPGVNLCILPGYAHICARVCYARQCSRTQRGAITGACLW